MHTYHIELLNDLIQSDKARYIAYCTEMIE